MLVLSHNYVWYQEAQERNAWGLNPSSFDDHKRECHLKVITGITENISAIWNFRSRCWWFENGKEDDSENDEDDACVDLKKLKQI